MASSKVSVSPSFKGNSTNIMRQRQLFLDATRASASESNSNNGVLTRLWKRVSMLVPGRKGVSVGVGVAIGLAISTQIPASLRCIPQGLYSHSSSSSSSSSYAWTAIGREALDKIIAVNSLVLMGLTSTVISAVILSAFRPFGSLRCCRTTTTESAESGYESGSGSGSGSGSVSDTTFDALFYEEYDTMMSASASTSDSASASASSGEPASFSAVPVTTPRCELVITYVPARSAFGYYTDRKDSIPYSHLETAARMFLVKNARPDLAKLAYADRRAGGRQAPPLNPLVVKEGYGEPLVPCAAPVADTTTSGSGGGIFAMFKSYNRKPAAAASSDSTTTTSTSAASNSAVAPATDTHFVYMGTMQDYKATRDKSKRSPTSRSSGSGSSVGCEETPYVNVKYTEFKSRSKL